LPEDLADSNIVPVRLIGADTKESEETDEE